MDLAGVTLATLTPHLQTTFSVDAPGGAGLKLVEATSLGQPYQPGSREPFSLIFTGEVVLPQRVWLLTHPVLGETEIFLVPIQPEAGCQRYQAIFT